MGVCCMGVTMDCESLHLTKVPICWHLVLISCENIVLWRGHFNATGDEKSVNLSINGGEGKLLLLIGVRFFKFVLSAFAASVWLNDVFLNTSFGKWVIRQRSFLSPIISSDNLGSSTNNQNILEETDDVFTFPEGSLKAGEDNVITIVQVSH